MKIFHHLPGGNEEHAGNLSALPLLLQRFGPCIFLEQLWDVSTFTNLIPTLKRYYGCKFWSYGLHCESKLGWFWQ